MRLLRFLLPLAAALLPAPALADVTARYSAGGSTLTVEVAANGDSRFEMAGKTQVVLFHRDGADYLAIHTEAEGNRVARLGDALTALIGPEPLGHSMHFVSNRLGADSVLGYSGTVFSFGPDDEPPLEFLMSPDPRLAPVGNVFRNLLEQFFAVEGGKLFDPALVRPIFASGTPVRIGSPKDASGPALLIELQSVSMDPIDPHRLELPGPVIPAEQVGPILSRPIPTHAEKVEVR
jgi:hypothetical protein